MSMPNLKVVMPQDDVEIESEERAEQRPEELRLLEAMLFASAAPLDEKELAARLPQGVDVRAALAQLQEDYSTRGVNLVRICGQVDLPHRERSVLAAEQGDGRDPQAVARRDRDAGHHRLSPAGHARRDRGDPRRHDVQGLGRRAAGDRLDSPARPAQGAGPSGDLRHQRRVPLAFRARRGRRPAGARGTQRFRHARRAAAAGLLGADADRTIRRCMTTRTRSSPATSISVLRRAPAGTRTSDTGIWLIAANGRCATSVSNALAGARGWPPAACCAA